MCWACRVRIDHEITHNMTFFYTLFGDAILFAAIIWFAGYGGTGPATGIRLGMKNKARLYGEVFVITIALLCLVMTGDRLLGSTSAASITAESSTYRLIAMAAILTAGFYYTRRRAKALHEPLEGEVHGADAAVQHRANQDGNNNND